MQARFVQTSPREAPKVVLFNPKGKNRSVGFRFHMKSDHGGSEVGHKGYNPT